MRADLPRNPSCAYHRPHIKKQGQLRTADAYHRATILAPMRPRERNGALAVYDPGQIRRLAVGELPWRHATPCICWVLRILPAMPVKAQAENLVDLRNYARRAAGDGARAFGPGIGSRPLRAGNRRLVEAGGQHIRGSRRGLDYAFVRAPLKAVRGRGACYPAATAGWILVPAQALCRRRVYESLQGRPEVGPLPTPRRCHAAPVERRRQVSPM